jgi:hypothetical protein
MFQLLHCYMGLLFNKLLCKLGLDEVNMSKYVTDSVHKH